MKIKVDERKGITLISLAITIAVLIILASVATYSGISIIRQSKLNVFTAEMKLMQAEVNDLYDRYNDGEIDLITLGKDLDGQADSVFTGGASGITDKTDYRYYDKSTLEDLGIDRVDGEFYINIKTRSVVSHDGLEYEGVTYYTLEQLPDGLYNVEYEDRNNADIINNLTFDVSMENVGEGKWEMSVSNIKYDGYIDKWQVQYRKQGQAYWSTSERLNFTVTEKGVYEVKLVNGDIESNIVTYTPTLVKKWASEIDGNGEEEFLDIEKTSDGGYIAVGYTTSTDISGLTNKGSADCLIAKYDKNGNEQWKKSVGGSKYDWYNGVIELENGTYVAVGTILSTDVVDKNGNNIGHGYDWSINIDNFVGSMPASEGIIGTYDSNGNELSLKTTGKATDSFTEEDFISQINGDVVFDFSNVTSVNVIMQGIDKMSDGSFVITGKRFVGIPSAVSSDSICAGQFAIKYDSNGDEVTYSNIKYNLSSGNSTDIVSIDNYKDISVLERSWNGVIEKKNKEYILFGSGLSPAGSTGLWHSDSNLTNIQDFGDARSIVKNCFLDKEENYITLNYGIGNDDFFLRIEKQDDSGMIWEYTDKVIKSISKSSSDDFVGISEDDKFLKYSMEDGSVIAEYSIPTYENVYAIEGEDEFILLGTPENEEGITITGGKGAVIAKYTIE